MRPRIDGLLARNILWMGSGQAVSTVVQAIYFIIIARTLGPDGYGAFVGVVALVAVASPFASLGSGNLLVKHVSRDPDAFSRQWGKAIGTTLIGGTCLLALVTLIARVVLPPVIPLGLILAVGAADLIFVRLVDISALAYQGVQRLHRTAQLQLLVNPLRMMAAGVLLLTTPEPTAGHWGVFYFASAAVAGCLAITIVIRELGLPQFGLEHLRSEMREGAYFSIGLSAQTIYVDIDKTMLARLATLDATGVYAAAYRVVDVTFLPVGALVSATYARFFQHGVEGVRATANMPATLPPWAEATASSPRPASTSSPRSSRPSSARSTATRSPRCAGSPCSRCSRDCTTSAPTR